MSDVLAWWAGALVAAGLVLTWTVRRPNRGRSWTPDVGTLTDILLEHWTVVTMSGPGPNEWAWKVRCDTADDQAEFYAPTAREALMLAINEMNLAEHAKDAPPPADAESGAS